MPSSDLSLGLIWELVSKTAIVVALLYAVLWTVRRLSAGSRLAPGGAGILVLHSVQLGPGRSVHLLAVGGRTLLVGSTSQQVSMLTEVGALEELGVAPGEVAQPFDRYLNQASDTLRSLPARLRQSRGGRQTGD